MRTTSRFRSRWRAAGGGSRSRTPISGGGSRDTTDPSPAVSPGFAQNYFCCGAPNFFAPPARRNFLPIHPAATQWPRRFRFGCLCGRLRTLYIIWPDRIRPFGAPAPSQDIPHGARTRHPRRQIRSRTGPRLRDRLPGDRAHVPDAEGARSPRRPQYGRLRHRLSRFPARRARLPVPARRRAVQGQRHPVPDRHQRGPRRDRAVGLSRAGGAARRRAATMACSACGTPRHEEPGRRPLG